MTYLNKKRSGDENIGKLIMFSITIIIAVGLVGLITYFYNSSRQNAVAGSVLGSSASSVKDINNVIKNITESSTSGCAWADSFTYNAISWKYTIHNVTTASDCTWSTKWLTHKNLLKVIDSTTVKAIDAEDDGNTDDVEYKLK